jgi:paraquat-inducible protein A
MTDQQEALEADALDVDVPGTQAGDTLRECPQCGLVSILPAPRASFVAQCPRCEHKLWRMRRSPFEFPLACGLAGLLFYAFALVAPFLEISAYGRFQLGRISTGPVQLADQGFATVALLVFAVTIIFPGVKLAILLLTLMGVQSRLLPTRPKVLKFLFRWYAPVTPWAMIDVYLLGFLVAYTRLAGIASVHLDTALYALIGLMISMAAADASLDNEAVWRALDAYPGGEPVPEPAPVPAGCITIGCHHCGLLNSAPPGVSARCRRCHGPLRLRKINSLSRSWALAGAAAMLYIPANIYPVMMITQVARTTSYTIFGGIEELVAYDLWPLALLVFFASITIPLTKLVLLAYMLWQTQHGSTTHLMGRTRAYRVVDFIGRWSMIDVFMISILVALVRFGQFAQVQAEIGATCFASVVVLTMFAVATFDPRLMWDARPRPAAAETREDQIPA